MATRPCYSIGLLNQNIIQFAGGQTRGLINDEKATARDYLNKLLSRTEADANNQVRTLI